MQQSIINNRIFINGKPTDQYVCDHCNSIVSDLREYEDMQVCSECIDELEKEEEE